MLGRGQITESNIREGMDLVRKSLLEADVSVSVVREFVANVTEKSLGEEVLKVAFESLRLSARARNRILKVARTIADLDYSETVNPVHLYEAISYRTYGAQLSDFE